MQYINHYDSPLGKILLASDGRGLAGLWFEGQKYFALQLGDAGCRAKTRDLPIFVEAKRWLDIYFSGKEPDFNVPVHLEGTEFQQEVWEILCGIPYGRTTTYGEIAGKLADRRGLERMSAQAVGGAVGHNPVSIMVPCHRVVGADGSLTGYAGGIDRKIALLEIEKTDMSGFFVPKKGTAL